MRKNLVEEISKKGFSDETILSVIEKIPRHCFIDKATNKTTLDAALLSHIYEDKALQIGAGQTISQPYTVAVQTKLLELKKGDRVLEIGTGSGYQTAVLLELGVKVFSIERQKSLYDKTKIFLPEMGYKAKLFYGDGYLGLPTFAPFDKILVTAGAPAVPEALKQQLKTGGILVIPVGEGGLQTMLQIRKKSETEFETTECGHFRFVPMLEEKEWGNQRNAN